MWNKSDVGVYKAGKAMNVTVNGKVRDLPEGATIEQLLGDLAIRRDAIAVEVNRQIVSRSQHADTRLREGDAVEIVTFVGGG